MNKKSQRSPVKIKDSEAEVQQVQIEGKSLSIYSGPLPQPEQLASYEKIFSGSAERIFEMAEGQIKHRQYLEKKTVDTESRNSTLGVVFAFILGVIAILGGVYISSCGYSISGLGTVFVGLAALVGVFIYGKEANKKELLEKQKLINLMTHRQ